MELFDLCMLDAFAPSVPAALAFGVRGAVLWAPDSILALGNKRE